MGFKFGCGLERILERVPFLVLARAKHASSLRVLIGLYQIYWRGRIRDSPLRLLNGFPLGGLGGVGALKNLVGITRLETFTAMLAFDLRFGQAREFR